MLGPTRCRATLWPCARPRDGPRLAVAAPRSQAYSEDWMLRCFSEHVDKRQQNILYADNLGGRPPARPSAPSRDLPFVLQEVHDLFIELLQSVPRSLIDFHVELDMLLQPPLLERPIISAPPSPPPPPRSTSRPRSRQVRHGTRRAAATFAPAHGSARIACCGISSKGTPPSHTCISSPISSYPIVHEHVLYHNHIMSSRRCTDEIQPIGAAFPKAHHHAPPVR